MAGLDPGLREGKTALALVEFKHGVATLLHVSRHSSIREAITLLVSLKPCVVAIDSPLSKPTVGVWRLIDLVGKRLGMKLLPPGWSSMGKLVENVLEALKVLPRDITVLETHPSSVLKASGCRDAATLAERCFDYIIAEWSTKDEEDAVISACVALCLLRGCWARVETIDGSIWVVTPLCTLEKLATGLR